MVQSLFFFVDEALFPLDVLEEVVGRLRDKADVVGKHL